MHNIWTYSCVCVIPGAGPRWRPAGCRSGGWSFRWSPAGSAADAPSGPEPRLWAGATAAAPSWHNTTQLLQINKSITNQTWLIINHNKGTDSLSHWAGFVKLISMHVIFCSVSCLGYFSLLFDCLFSAFPPKHIESVFSSHSFFNLFSGPCLFLDFGFPGSLYRYCLPVWTAHVVLTRACRDQPVSLK